MVENLYQDIINDTMRDYKTINELTGKLRWGGGRTEGGRRDEGGRKEGGRREG